MANIAEFVAPAGRPFGRHLTTWMRAWQAAVARARNRLFIARALRELRDPELLADAGIEPPVRECGELGVLALGLRSE